jgi:hypothetical protein
MKARMRDDLAKDGIAILAFEDVIEGEQYVGEQYVGEHYIGAEELVGAELEGNTENCDDPRYNYTRLRLSDNRLLYFIGVDLDFEENRA